MKRISIVCVCLTLGWGCSVLGRERMLYKGKTPREWLTGADDSNVLPSELRDRLAGLGDFGAAGQEVIPDLIELLKHRTEEAVKRMVISQELTPNRLSPTGEDAANVLAHIGPPAVPLLLKALENENPRVRAGAAFALGSMRPTQVQALPALRTAIKDRDEQVRLLAALAVQRMDGKTETLVPVLIDTLRARTPELRRQAVDELERLGPAGAAAVPALIEALRDEYLEEMRLLIRTELSHGDSIRLPQSRAVAALVAIGPVAAPALIEAAADRAPQVRASALLTLASLHPASKETLAILRGALKDREPVVRLIAAIHLWRHAQEVETVVPVLMELLKGTDLALSGAAAIALARIGSPARRAIPILIEHRKDRDRGEATRLALRLFGKEAVPALVSLLANKEDAQPVPLGREAVPALVRALESDNAIIRAAAAADLLSLDAHSPQVIAALREAARDIDSRVRFRALVGLARFDVLGKRDEVALALAEFLKLKTFPHREEAARTLLAMGHAARKALPVLREVIKDTNIREVAELLRFLEPGNPDAEAQFINWAIEQVKRDRGGYELARLPVAALPKLVPLLKTGVPNVRLNVLGTLARMDVEASQIVPLLLATLADGSTNRIARIAEVLVERAPNDPKVKAALLGLEKHLGKRDPDDEREVLEAIGRAGVEATAVYRRALTNPKMRKPAAEALEMIGRQGQPLLPVLLPLLDDKDPATRLAAARATIAVGGKIEPAVRTLGELLDSPELSVRRESAFILSSLVDREPSAVPLLVRGLQNSDRHAPLTLPTGFVGQQGAYGVQGYPGFNGPFLVGINYTNIGSLGGQMFPRGTGVWGGMRFPEYRSIQTFSVRSESALGLRQAGPAAREAVPVLITLFKQGDDGGRVLAANLLGEIGPRARPAVPLLREALKDRDRRVRAAAANALSRLDRRAVEAIPVLVETLREEIRTDVIPGPGIEGLARFGQPAVSALVTLLKDRHTVYRLADPLGLMPSPEAEVLAGQAAWALAEIGPDALEALPALLEVLREPPNRERPESYDGTDDLIHNLGRMELRQRSLRRTALHALSRIGPKARDAVPLLLRIAHDSVEGPAIRLAAAEALWRIERKAEPAASVGRELFLGRSSGLSLGHFAWLGELRPSVKDLVPLVVLQLEDPEQFGDPSTWDHLRAAQLLGRLGPSGEPGVARLRQLLRAPFPGLRANAAVALWRIEGKPGNLPRVLIDALSHWPWEGPDELLTGEEGLEAVATLGAMREAARDALPLLRTYLQDDNVLMRIHAAEALWRISGDEKAALAVLRRGLESGDKSLRLKSAEALGAFGAAARPARAALKELLEDAERDVRETAMAALKKIEER